MAESEFQKCPGHHAVVGAQSPGPREVELPLHEALGALVGEARRGDGARVDRHEPPAHHGIEVGRREPASVEVALHPRQLVRLDADREAVGHVRRHRLLPAHEQLRAHEREHQHRHEPEAQGDDLHEARPGAPPEVGEPVAPGPARRAPGSRRQRDEAVACQRRHRERRGEASHRDRAQLHIARLPHDQRGERGEARGIRGEAQGLGGGDSRRSTRNVDTLRRRSSGGSVNPSSTTMPITAPRTAGHGPGSGSSTVKNVASQRARIAWAPYPAAHPRAHPATPERRELPGVDPEEPRLGRPEAAHGGRRVHLALGEAPRRQRHRDGCEHDREQRREAEEALRPLERGAHLAARVAHAFHALAAAEHARHFLAVALDRLRLAAQQQAIAHPAAHLDEPRGLQVRLVHQHARGDAEVIEHAVGLARDHRGDHEARTSHLQGVTHLHADARGERHPDPRGAGTRAAGDLAFGRAGRIGDADASPQREVRRHRLDVGEAHAAGRGNHARKGARACGFEPFPARGFGEGGRRRMVRDHHQIAAQELVRLGVECRPARGRRRSPRWSRSPPR